MEKPNHINETLYFILLWCWIFKAFPHSPESIFSCVCCALLLKIYPGNMQHPFIKLPNDFSNLIFHIWFLNLFEKQPGLWKEVMNCKCMCLWKLPRIFKPSTAALAQCKQWLHWVVLAAARCWWMSVHSCRVLRCATRRGSGRKSHCEEHLWVSAHVLE